MAEVLLYGRVDEYSATRFVEKINATPDVVDLTIRVNTPGGEPTYMYSLINKMKDYNYGVVVEGEAMSAGTFLLMYAEKGRREALDVSQFLIHRAAFPQWYEESESFKGSFMEENLVKMNADLERATRAAIDVEKLEKLKGIKLSDVFSMKARIDVGLTASEAKQIGLIDKIVKITPKKAAEIRATAERLGVDVLIPEAQTTTEITTIEKQQKSKDMSELKTQVAEAVANERNRIAAWMEFNDVDKDAVKAGIESGKEMTAADIAKLTKKMVDAAIAKPTPDKPAAHAVATPKKPIETPETPETEADKEVKSWLSEVKSALKEANQELKINSVVVEE